MRGTRCFFLFFLIDISHATDAVDWWGDPRANGATEFAFYDVTYDDTLCDDQASELRSDAIHDYVYMGRLLASAPVFELNDCLRKCLLKAHQCQAVNYYRASRSSVNAYCELLADTQYDNPLWMKKYPGGQYYENIHCQHGPDEDHPETSTSIITDHSQQAWKKALAIKLTKKIDAFMLRAKRV